MPVERPRVLHLGPDARGGMRAAIDALLSSPLANEYRLEFVSTHRGVQPLQRVFFYLTALLRLGWWSLSGRGRIVHIHATKRGSMFRKAALVLFARSMRRRVVLHFHAGPGDLAAFRGLLGPRRLAFLHRGICAADVVIAVSAASAEALEREFGARRVTVLPNIAPNGPLEPLSRPSGAPLALYLGGFANPVKGGDVLLEALALPGAAEPNIVLAGPGELPAAGQQLVEAGEGIVWRGWLGEVEKESLLREASIFVLASTSEGLPMALLEAMAYGLGIVATTVGGVPDVLENEVEALLVPPGDAVALADALRRLAGEEELRRRLGAAARGAARESGADRIAERLGAVYAALLAA